MKEFLGIEQHKDYPEKFFVLIFGKNFSGIPIYFYNEGLRLKFISGIKKIPFYIGTAIQTYFEEYSVPVIIYSYLELPPFSIIEVEPKLFLKIVGDKIYNFIVAKTVYEDIEIKNVKDLLKEFFNVPEEGIILESEYKAKAFLIHAHKEFLDRFIKL